MMLGGVRGSWELFLDTLWRIDPLQALVLNSARDCESLVVITWYRTGGNRFRIIGGMRVLKCLKLCQIHLLGPREQLDRLCNHLRLRPRQLWLHLKLYIPMQHSKLIFKAHRFKDHHRFVLLVDTLSSILWLIMTWTILKRFPIFDWHEFLWCAIYPLQWVRGGPTLPLVKLT